MKQFILQKENGMNLYIPDAGGYALTETVYTLDNNNRISRQGVVLMMLEGTGSVSG
ncbi:hypothetical protein SIO70_24215 [Chitinophaga sancti]|uniref:hypothetical protein n=1 Tax=Chitinophaga sancti TaxID=1004 RepID=UPI002A75D37D|nr:hypothetical protein [Chitinophaga sancti]WPQ61469.1 hypothetical protein SIO70_24215 [Chitinophaga sancti]